MPILGSTLLVSFFLRLWYILNVDTIWWDTAIYIDMGKYIFTGGTLGYFEPFRPPLFPLIMGTFWKLGLNPIFWAMLLEVIISLGTIYFVYKIGERIKSGSGIYAATILAFTPVYFYFTAVPLTDIPSAFLTLVAAYLLLKKKYVYSGVIMATAVLTRFPSGLILLPFALVMLLPIIKQTTHKVEVVKNIFTSGLLFSIGFLIPLLPYFIYAWKAFGNPFLPIIMASGFSAGGYGEAGDYLYYIGGFVKQNPFILLFIVGLGYYVYTLIKDWRSAIENKPMILTILSLIVVGGYFSHIQHKELRYGISFLPFLCLLAGYAISVIVHKIKWKHAAVTGVAIIALGLTLYSLGIVIKYGPHESTPKPFKDYFTYLSDKSPRDPSRHLRVFTTSPEMAAFADLKIMSLVEYWKDVDPLYQKYKADIDYVLLNSCNLYCKDGNCDDIKKQALINLEKETEKVFDQEINKCILRIYKIR